MKNSAKPFLENSKDFLRAAEIALAADLRSPALSLSVHSAILAKDALLMGFGIKPIKASSHRVAVAQLKSTGLLPESAVLQFSSLIAAKGAAEYDVEIFVVERAKTAVTRARRFIDNVEERLKDAGT